MPTSRVDVWLKLAGTGFLIPERFEVVAGDSLSARQEAEERLRDAGYTEGEIDGAAFHLVLPS